MRPWCVVVLASLLLAGCGGEKEAAKVPIRPEPTKERVESAMAVVEASNAFGLRLLELVAEKTDKPNILISPISLQMASALLLESATGPERDEMKHALGLGAIPDKDLGTLVETLTDALLSDPEGPLHVANAVWLTRPVQVEKPFADRVAQRYRGEIGVSKTPEEAKDAINAWVNKNTNGMIPQLLDFVAPGEMVFLLNAVAFEGRWQKEFKPEWTQSEPFTTLSGRPVQAPQMRGMFEAFEAQETEYAALRMDYRGGRFSMIAFLPPEAKTPRDVLATLQHKGFAAVAEGFNASEVDVKFPKFRWEDDHTLKEAFQALGVRKAFEHLDQSPLSQELAQGIALTRVLQKTLVEVDEKGTRAAAATAEATGSASVPLVFNRPFLYMVVHNKTGVILFLGICGDPTVEK